MSFLGASGAGGQSGRGIVPLTPTSFTFSRLVANNGDPAKFWVYNIVNPSQAGASQKTSRNITANIYKTSDNTLFQSVDNADFIQYIGTNLVVGTSYYVKLQQNDTITGIKSPETAASSSLVAMTKPANMGTITATNGVGLLNTSWTAVNAGGDSSVTYSMTLYQSSNSGSSYSQLSTATTTNTSYAWGSLPGGSTYYYYVTITPSNSLGASNSSTTNGVNVTSAAPPPPYFAPPPPPPYFPPSFGPYFACIEANTPVMVWADDKTLYKKAEDIKIGDRLVSYSFNELPESEFDYSIDTWNHETLTPKNVENAEVVSIQELITKATMYLNKDINTRMSLEHSVFVKRDGNYSIIASGLIEPGDTVIQINPETLELGEIIVDSVDYVDEESKIYKIDCKPYDVFFAGNILTHNRKKFY